jgi:hypothetical protein
MLSRSDGDDAKLLSTILPNNIKTRLCQKHVAINPSEIFNPFSYAFSFTLKGMEVHIFRNNNFAGQQVQQNFSFRCALVALEGISAYHGFKFFWTPACITAVPVRDILAAL